MSHSRGPWRAAIGGDNRIPKQGEDETEIACLPHYRYDALDVFGPELGRQLTYEELEGNALLIAAAPELLEAAKEALRLFRYNVEDAADAADFAAAVEIQIEAAIKKAEGEGNVQR